TSVSWRSCVSRKSKEVCVLEVGEMKLVVSLGNKSLVSELRNGGMRPEYLSGTSLVPLVPDRTYGPVRQTQVIYRLPYPLSRLSRSSLSGILRLYGSEQGGGGSPAAVVCGGSGRPLRPFHQEPRFSQEFPTTQAVFLLTGSGVVLSGSRENKKAVIRRYWVVLDNGVIVLSVDTWRVDRKLPRPCLGFENALTALRGKISADEPSIFYADIKRTKLQEHEAEQSVLVATV
ncbi:MAG: hypothetical protein M1312_01830, partial [Patescibacteria group bacterium]|nr:hypothetical protein [Patescibacteria group bacterium]